MQTITVLTLPAPEAMTIRQLETIRGSDLVFVQTGLHPTASELTARGVAYQTMDDLFESCEDFDALNLSIANRLLDAGDCVYVATGSIAASQLPQIAQEAKNRHALVRVLPGVSVGDAAFPALERAAALSAHDLPDSLEPEQNYIVEEIDSSLAAGEVKLLFSEYLPDEWKIRIASIAEDGNYRSREIALFELDRQPDYDATTVAYFTRSSYQQRVRHGLDDVMRVVRRLRAPDGCPWDREQTHESLKNALLEECYELVDAINEGDDAHICEELGDVLLQFALHAAIAEEQSAFTARDACTELVEKLIYRHPHVFGDIRVSGSDEVLKNWDALKMAKRNQQTQAEVLKSVPRSFPALLRSRKVQKKAADVGFDWKNANEAFPKILEEANELKDAMERGTNIAEEMGDLLFSVVNVSRLLKQEPEFLLMDATEKFIERFEAMEKLALSQGAQLVELSFNEQDQLWNSVKKSRLRE